MENEPAIYLSVEDKSNQDERFFLSGQTIAVLDRDNLFLEVVPSLTRDDNYSITEGKFEIDEQGKINGRMTVELGGANNPFFNIYIDNSAINTLAKKIYPSTSIAESGFKEISRNKLKTSFTLQGDVQIKEHENFRFLPLPRNPQGFDDFQFSTLPVTRYTPLQLPHVFSEQNKFIFNTATNLQLVTPQTDITKSNSVGELHIRINQQDNSIVVIRNLTINLEVIPVEQYAKFHELWRLWQASDYRQLCYKIK